MSEDINAEILAELRKLKRVFYIILIFIFVGSLPAFYAAFTRPSTSGDSWARVRTAMDHQDFSAALSMAQALTARQPDYYYGHAFLGIYLFGYGRRYQFRGTVFAGISVVSERGWREGFGSSSEAVGGRRRFQTIVQMRLTLPNKIR